MVESQSAQNRQAAFEALQAQRRRSWPNLLQEHQQQQQQQQEVRHMQQLQQMHAQQQLQQQHQQQIKTFQNQGQFYTTAQGRFGGQGTGGGVYIPQQRIPEQLPAPGQQQLPQHRVSFSGYPSSSPPWSSSSSSFPSSSFPSSSSTSYGHRDSRDRNSSFSEYRG